MSAAAYQRVPTTPADGLRGRGTERVQSQSNPTSKSKRAARIVLLGLVAGVILVGFYLWGKYSRPTLDQRPAPQQGSDGHLAPPSEDESTGKSDSETMDPKVNFGYFVNWGIYGRKYPPSLIPVQDLTHVLYAFANIRPDSGEVFISDAWADKDIRHPGDSWDEPGNNLYGNLGALYKLKKQHRHLKVLISIGGWSYSSSFHPVVISPRLRSNFVTSAIRLLEDYGLDGLDVDYEYPGNDDQARGYAELLRELREALDEHARQKGANYRFLLTIAAPCGPDNYEKLHATEMNKYLDFWNLMAYDYSGPWDSTAGHQASVYGGSLNTHQAVTWYTGRGISPQKLVIGIPLYGRSFLNTEGPGNTFTGVGPGSWEAGVYDYRALPLPNSYLFRDDKNVASWSYDYQKKEMISFDSEDVAFWKGKWIQDAGFAGSMFWELSGDKGNSREGMEGGEGKTAQPGRSLVSVLKESMGQLDYSGNWLQYEGSQFENMKKGMN